MAYKLKYPLRTYLGKYEKWVLVMYGRGKFNHHNYVLEEFFSTFPGREWLEDFNSVDITDYVEILRKRGAQEQSISRKLSVIRQFWTWLIEDAGLFLQNPVRAFYRLKPWSPQREELSLLQVQRLLNECTSVKDKKTILGIVCGDKCPAWRASQRIRDAAQRAGLKNFRLNKLKGIATKRMRDDIVKLYCQQILDTLPMESQQNGNALTTVQAAASNERTPIFNGDDYPLVCNGVEQQEPGTER